MGFEADYYREQSMIDHDLVVPPIKLVIDTLRFAFGDAALVYQWSNSVTVVFKEGERVYEINSFQKDWTSISKTQVVNEILARVERRRKAIREEQNDRREQT